MSQDTKQSAIEAAAEAIRRQGGFSDDKYEHGWSIGYARAAILALRQWMDAEGLVVVPREATERMFRAGSLFRLTSPVEVSGYKDTVGIYAAMIAAAPDALKATDSAQDGGE